MATPHPQDAYAAFTKSLQCEWIYLQRVIPDCRTLLAPLENAVFTSFLPAVFGCEISPLEFELFSLPVRFGGLGILLPNHLAKTLYDASRSATHTIVDSIRNSLGFELDAENEKKKKYLDAAAARRTHFTPLCFSVDGIAGSEAASFLKRLAYCLSAHWERSYADIMYWIRARISFAVLRATVLCVRGSHTRWRCLGLEDGASIDFT